MSWTFDGVVEFACLGKKKYRAMFCLLDALISIDLDKGGLISEFVSICLKSPKQGAKLLS